MSGLRILHLSDTHFSGDGGRHYGVVDTVEHLRRALGHVGHLLFDLVVVSGDASDLTDIENRIQLVIKRGRIVRDFRKVSAA